MMTLVQRVFRDKRSTIVPLLVGLALNIGAYLFVVRPMGIRSATAAQRAESAAVSLASAQRDYNAANSLVTGKRAAERELSTFYDKVLPPDQSAARRMTYVALPALARQANVKYDERRTEVEPVKNQRLGRLRISMVLEGEYENIRRFIYELENASTFVIIDDVSLSQGDMTKPLVLTLELSTYYRTSANGD
jgi:Tfp pilus assembly protein PilO